MAYRSWRIVHSEASLGWGGQEHRVLAELAGFQKRGSRVWLLAPRDSRIFQRAQAAGIPAVHLQIGKVRLPLEAVRIARWLRQNQIQILNTHSSADGWQVGLAGRLARLPLILRTRHIDVDYPNRWLSRQAYTTLADHVLVTSGKIKAHFQEIFRLPDDRISVVPTGVDLNLFSPEASKASLPFKNSPGLRVIGMVSVLRSWKGHSTFLEAARRLLDEGFAARFVIVGEGPVHARIKEQIAELNLGDIVTLTGHREDVPEILRALDALVIPSTKHEGIPQIGLQALAVKTPVIGSDAGGIPEIIRHGEAGRIFAAGNANALAAAIRETLRETEATKKMTDTGHKWVETGHSLEKMLSDLESIYRRHLPA
jgi:glycosyltransferase involved in cell wall biosynthesis